MKKYNKYRRALVGVYSMLGVYGGGTICINSGDAPTSGYVVGLKTLGTFESLKDVDISSLEKPLRVLSLDISDLCAGSFKDPKTGNYLIEASKVIRDKEIAINLAKNFNQSYIFDLQKSELLSV